MPKKTESPPDLDTQSQEGVAVAEEREVKRPKRYKVLLHNDDYTTMEFVLLVLKQIFRHSEENAMAIMLKVHREGMGIAGLYTYEIAETKASQTMQMARKEQFPLRCSLEAE